MTIQFLRLFSRHPSAPEKLPGQQGETKHTPQYVHYIHRLYCTVCVLVCRPTFQNTLHISAYQTSVKTRLEHYNLMYTLFQYIQYLLLTVYRFRHNKKLFTVIKEHQSTVQYTYEYIIKITFEHSKLHRTTCIVHTVLFIFVQSFHPVVIMNQSKIKYSI